MSRPQAVSRLRVLLVLIAMIKLIHVFLLDCHQARP